MEKFFFSHVFFFFPQYFTSSLRDQSIIDFFLIKKNHIEKIGFKKKFPEMKISR